MKSFSHWLFYPAILTMLIACGKDNESGKNGAAAPFNPVYQPVTSPYVNSSGSSVNLVIAQNPCTNGFTGMPGMTQPYSNQRFQFQVDVNPQTFDPPTHIGLGDFFVGVTSFGDVAVIVGRGLGQPANFIGYLCPRPSPDGQGTVERYIKIGEATPKCSFKPIVAATVHFPAGEPARFRMLEGGNSLRQPFQPPVCIP
jgi:hypothetical protein